MVVPDTSPPFIFTGARNYRDPSVRTAFDAAGAFHDSVRDRVDVKANIVSLHIGPVFFIPANRTDAYGTNGARVELIVAPGSSRSMLALLGDQSDRDILRFEFNLEPPAVLLSVMDTAIWNAQEFRLSIEPNASWFAWVFG